MLHALDTQVEEQKVDKKPFPIDTERFSKEYPHILAHIESSFKNYLQAIFEQNNYEINGTEWIQKVSNSLDAQVIEQEKEQIVAWMRKKLDNPWIVLKAVIDETLAHSMPITESEEDKLRKTIQEYPAFIELWEKFQLKLLR